MLRLSRKCFHRPLLLLQLHPRLSPVRLTSECMDLKFEHFGFHKKIHQLNVTKYQLNQVYSMNSSAKNTRRTNPEYSIESKKSLKLMFNQESIALMLNGFPIEIRKVFSELWTKLDNEYAHECLFCGNMIIDWAFKPFDLNNKIFQI